MLHDAAKIVKVERRKIKKTQGGLNV